MRYFIKNLDLLFEDYMTIESKEEYIDVNDLLAIDVYAKVGYGNESPLICFTFAIGYDLTPMIVMCEDPETFEEPEREYIYAFAMFTLLDMYKDLYKTNIELKERITTNSTNLKKATEPTEKRASKRGL